MSTRRGSITIDPQGATLDVDVLLRGVSTTAYTTATGAGTVSFPLEISDVTTVWVPRSDEYTVTATWGGNPLTSEAASVGSQAAHDPTIRFTVPELLLGQVPAGGGDTTAATVHLNGTELMDPNTTKEILPAPGAGKVIIPGLQWIVEFKKETVEYTGSVLFPCWNNDGNLAAAQIAIELPQQSLTSEGSTIGYVINGDKIGENIADAEDKNLALFIGTFSADAGPPYDGDFWITNVGYTVYDLH